ncbi:MAG TPA: family 20 glycosylhydrolase [Blastocatellia bacterium]|nr:family 20 glycosylhydrolase [Blastocatellia bacterium]
MTSESRHNLLPVPVAVQFKPGRLAITKSFSVAVRGHQDNRVMAGIDRAVRRLEGRIGMELARGLADDAATATLLVECQGPGQDVPSLNENESYSLGVSERQAVLNAATAVGVLRGLETFLQLLGSDRDGDFIPAVSIEDKPRFPWRGLMIDSSRHFQPLEVIKRNLDGMAAVKLNVLHWHLVDDQGFRVETSRYPKLYLLGSDKLYYTQDQVRDVIAYARDRGIRVVPEFDIPGHATSWLVGHPELGSAPGPYQIERQAGIFEPALDPTREEVYKLLDGFLGEMAGLFPDAYIHIGGDENEGKQWDRNPQIQAFMKAKGIKNNHELQAHFNKRIAQILKKYNKKMIGWEEILHPELPRDIVVHSWRGPAALAEAAKKGFSGILSAGYYIDLMFPASEHYAVDPIAANSGLSEQQAALVLGGEATMWSEYVSPETIDSRIWPRTAAIAERFWSPRTVTDVDDMYRRLKVISIQLEELGPMHERNTPVLLRRLAKSHDIKPLRTLLSVIEPVKRYNRGRLHPTTMLSPLTSLVDAARPDAEAARPFAALVDGLLADAPRFQTNQESLRAMLTEWRDLRPTIDAMISRSAALRDAEPFARDLSELATAGLEALSHLSAGTAPSQEWREAKMAMIAQAAKPKAALEFVILSGVRQLVIAAAEAPQLKTTPQAEWIRRVKTLAGEKNSESGN